MKITICGSVKFAEKLVEIYNQLKEIGHEIEAMVDVVINGDLKIIT